MPTATLTKFGYPATLIAETPHWALLLRPAQATLGALVLVCREPVTAFGAVSVAGFAELHGLTGRIEALLQGFTGYQRINWLMLMMVDPDVHFHILPRYAEPRIFEGIAVADAGWPGPPDLSAAVTLPQEAQARLVQELRTRWAAQM